MSEARVQATLKSAEAALVLMRKRAWDDFYYFAKYVVGFSLMEEKPHRELCDLLVAGVTSSQTLGIKCAPLNLTRQRETLRKLILWPRGSFKCVPENTLVTMYDGSVKHIVDIEPGEVVLGVDTDTLRHVPSLVRASEKTGVRPAIKFTTSAGQNTITTSPEHRFFTERGYVEAKDLVIGDWVALSASQPGAEVDGGEDYPMSDAEIKMLAYLIFEGSLTGGNCSFTNCDSDVVADFEKCARELGYGVSRRKDGKTFSLTDSGSSPRDFSRLHGIHGTLAKHKKLPLYVTRFSRRQKWLFISAMFATDGYFSVDAHDRGNNRKHRCHIGLNVASRALRDDIHALLMTLGVRMSMCEWDVPAKNGKVFHAYGVSTGAAEEIVKLREMQYPYEVKRETLRRALDVADSIVAGHRDSVTDTMPFSAKELVTKPWHWYRDHGCRVDSNYSSTRAKYRRLSEIDPDGEWSKYAESPVFWRRISAIEHTQAVPMCDISTTTENFIAHGFVVHNSSISTQAFPVWMLWHNPNLRILIDSETMHNAKTYLAGIRSVITNNKMVKAVCVNEKGEYMLEPAYKTANGFTDDSVILASRTNANLKEPTIFCSGVDNARTGMHVDVILMDDLVSERNVTTTAQIEKTYDHYRMSRSLLDPGGLQIIIGTRYHLSDMYGQLMALHAEDDSDDINSMSITVKPAKSDDGVLLFPQRLTDKFLEEQRKAQGSYIFSCQYMLNPIDSSDAVFRKEDIQKYDTIPADIVAKYIAVDPTVTESERSDFFVSLCIGVTRDNHIYVLDYSHEKCSVRDGLQAVIALYQKWDTDGKVRAVGLESYAAQRALKIPLQEEMRRCGVHFRIIPLNHGRSTKEDHIMTKLQPITERQEMHIRPHMMELMNQFEEYPRVKHDDLLDALAYAIQMMRPSGSYATDRIKPVYEAASRKTGY